MKTPAELRGAAAGAVGALTGTYRREREHWGYSRWHAMDVRRFPEESRRFARDIPRLIREDIVPGYAPAAPMLEAGERLVVIGSSFARELHEVLRGLGGEVDPVSVPDLPDTFAMLDFASSALAAGGPGGRGREQQGALREAGAIVLTLESSEISQGQRLSSVEENEDNLERIVGLLRSANAGAPIVLMLSPESIAATVRDMPCLPADCISKSVLRAACDRLLARGHEGVYYWPAFEVVRWAGAHMPWRALGQDGQPRSASRYLVEAIGDAFVDAFYTPAAALELRRRAIGRRTPSPTSFRGRVRRARSQPSTAPMPDRFPETQRVFDRDFPRLIRDWIAPGYAPEAPLLAASDSVVTLGSCFARELRAYLGGLGFTSDNFWIPSGLNNTFALLDFVSWCVTGSETGSGFRYDRLEGGRIKEWTPEGRRAGYEARLAEAGAFVFTIGLAEVWEDRETGGVFWRGIPEEIFDAGRHVFRLTTVDENEQNLVDLIDLIRRVNPSAPIVLTLSPVPLLATFSGRSCLPSDAVSKSVLRVAIDRVTTGGFEGVYYWPSFEVVRWAGAHLPWSAYGIPDRRARHVSRYVVAQIIEAFVEAFYTSAAVSELRARRDQRLEPEPPSVRGRTRTALYPLRTGLDARRSRLNRSTAGAAIVRAPRRLRRGIRVARGHLAATVRR